MIEFRNKKILFGANEAGSGSLLAELAVSWETKPGSLALATIVSNDYFVNKCINTRIVDSTVTIEETIKIIQEIDPDIVVVGASVGLSIEKKLILASLQMNKTVVAFVDHYWNLWQRFAHEDTAERWFYKPDYIFVPALDCLNRIISQGALPEKLFVFEHPLINKSNIDSPKFDESEVREKLNLSQDEFIILFISEYNFVNTDKWQWEQSSEKDIKYLLINLLNCVNKLSIKRQNIKVIVKMHPSQEDDFSDILYDFSENCYRVVNSFDKASLFQICNVAFGLNSMLLLEVARYGVPTYSYYGLDLNNRTHLCEIHNEIKEISDLNLCSEIITNFF